MTRASFLREWRLVVGLVVIGAIFALAAFAPAIAPHDPMDQSLLNQNLPPAWMEHGDRAFLLGTDSLGRDLLSRLVYGARPALLVMLLGATFSGLLGVSLGLLAGYFGGTPDRLISRVVEVFMSFPPMLLAIVLVAVIGPGLGAVIVAVVLIGWTRFCRLVRGEMLALKEADFVTAGRAGGMSHVQILLREILPNLVPILTVLMGLEMGRAIVAEAVLSFIGFSSSGTATWGGMIADARSYLNQAWWSMTYPILAIVIAVLGLNALGDGLRAVTDPVMRR